MRAYAYKLINYELFEAAYEGSTSTVRRNKLLAVEGSLRQTGGFLTAGETEQAVNLAKELLANNAYCCRGTWY